MKRSILASGVFGLVVQAAFVSGAHAAITTFFGEDFQPDPVNPVVLSSHPNSSAAQTQFLSNLNGVTTQDFESFATGTQAPLTVSFGSDTATITGSDAAIDTSSIGIGAGRFATSGTQYLETDTATTISFSHPQAAFGFYATDAGDFGGSITLTLANGTSDVVTVPNDITTKSNGSVLYEGLIAPAGSEFTSVTFGDTAAGTDIFGFDDFTIGETGNVVPPPVPEPTSIALVTIGAGLFCGRRPSKNRN